MKFQAAIFDMDGTIVLTEEHWQQASIDLIEKYNGPLCEDSKVKVLELTTGAGLEQSARIIEKLRHAGIPQKFCTALNFPLAFNHDSKNSDITVLMQEYKDRALSYYAQGISYVHGFEEFYKKLQSLEIPTAIATNAPSDILQATDNALNLKKYFGNHMYSISHVNNISKPNPAIYLYAAQQLGIDPKKCLAFEDSIPGITAAKAAGMYCVGIRNHTHPAFSQDADFIINSYDQIDLSRFF